MRLPIPADPARMLQQLDFTAVQYAAIMAGALLGGLVRGFGGFGTALIVTPVLSVIVGPRAAVPAVTLALFLTTLQLIPTTWMHVRWREQWVLSLSGCLGVPAGVALLVWLDPELLRRAISAATAASAVLLMTGWRYSGASSLPAAAAAGWSGGFLSGAASIGGPPVIAYLLAGQGSPAQMRASIVFYFAFTQVASMTLYALSELITVRTLVVAALITPSLLLGTWYGSRLFRRSSEKNFRWVALFILLAVGLVTLVI